MFLQNKQLSKHCKTAGSVGNSKNRNESDEEGVSPIHVGIHVLVCE